AMVEVVLFAGILLLGLAYVWAKGDLDWVKPQPIRPVVNVPIPDAEYESFNENMG
ncbi:MAG: NADH-quinone oxidoreductase subunit A, partial [Bacteroidota bacterium]